MCVCVCVCVRRVYHEGLSRYGERDRLCVSVCVCVCVCSQVSVSAGLSFVPAQNFPFPTYRGIWVTSTIQLQNATTGLAVGPSLKQVPLGSVVLITIQVCMCPCMNFQPFSTT